MGEEEEGMLYAQALKPYKSLVHSLTILSSCSKALSHYDSFNSVLFLLICISLVLDVKGKQAGWSALWAAFGRVKI